MSKVSESPFLLSDYDKLMFIRQDNSTKERMKSVRESQEDSNVSTGHLPQDIVDKFMNIDVDWVQQDNDRQNWAFLTPMQTQILILFPLFFLNVNILW